MFSLQWNCFLWRDSFIFWKISQSQGLMCRSMVGVQEFPTVTIPEGLLYWHPYGCMHYYATVRCVQKYGHLCSIAGHTMLWGRTVVLGIDSLVPWDCMNIICHSCTLTLLGSWQNFFNHFQKQTFLFLCIFFLN